MKELYKIYTKYPTISTDSRDVSKGSIFFALRGDSFDGNDYAAAALEKGAALAVVDNPKVAVSDRYIVVDDVLSSLQHLATYHRSALGIPILAITGSNGKTTTKELVARVLSYRYKVAVTRGNLNNHIGVPLTLLAMTRDTEFGVVEMGASATGEVEFLCNIAQPNFGVITNIGRAHLEGFGSLAGVRQGKGELFKYLASHNGLAFYLMDDPTLVEMVHEHEKLLAKGYGAHIAGGIKSHLTGDYNRYNIAAAVAVGEYFGVTHGEISRAIGGYMPDNLRSQRMDTGRNILMVDCYNANPSSMKAAIENFMQEKTIRPKIVILGDMLELGSYSADEHASILDLLEGKGVKNTILVGENFLSALSQAPTSASNGRVIASFEKVDALYCYLTDNPIIGSAVLLKASRSINLDRVVELL